MSGTDSGGATVSLDGERLRVAGSIDFDSAPGVLEQVAGSIRSTPALTIDLGEVQRSNSAGLALMIEWLAIARRQGHSVRFERVPEGLRQIARVCQVESMLSG